MTGSAPSFQDLTTMGVGGDPRGLLFADTTEHLVEFATASWASGEPTLILGGGSNLIVSDSGFDGTTIAPRSTGLRVVESDSQILLTIDAGMVWDDLVAETVANGWAGLESLSGIPGRVGAAPVQNIGAYGHEIAEVLDSIEFLDRSTGARRTLTAAECGFGYRSSVFKARPAGEPARDGVVLSATVRLNLGGRSLPVRYGQLAEVLGVATDSTVPISDLRAAVLEIRHAKGMVFDPADPDTHGCGSFFTNPVVAASFAAEIPADAPRFPVESDGDSEPGQIKLSAAWLIEHAGVVRGFALPGSRAAISAKHTLAITNRGGATAAEVIELARFVSTRVLNEFGVSLQPEPVLVGLEL